MSLKDLLNGNQLKESKSQRDLLRNRIESGKIDPSQKTFYPDL